MNARPAIFCDFDGTMTQADVTDLTLERLADPSWRVIEDTWVRGAIGSRECLERQMALVRASVDDLNTLIDSVPVDPHLMDFIRFTQARAVPCYVLTDSFDYVVRRILTRSGQNGLHRRRIRVFASHLCVEGRRLRVAFPHSGCEHGCATCKPELMRRLRRNRRPVIFIGDGLSDRFAVHEADLIFAKGALADYCRENGLACRGFKTFREVIAALED